MSQPPAHDLCLGGSRRADQRRVWPSRSHLPAPLISASPGFGRYSCCRGMAATVKLRKRVVCRSARCDMSRAVSLPRRSSVGAMRLSSSLPCRATRQTMPRQDALRVGSHIGNFSKSRVWRGFRQVGPRKNDTPFALRLATPFSLRLGDQPTTKREKIGFIRSRLLTHHVVRKIRHQR
jgi:hypothetical protein